MEVISFSSKFVDAAAMQEAGSSSSTYWVLKDDNIKAWVKTPAVIAAFTSLVLNSYSSQRCVMPACVATDTKRWKVDQGLVSIQGAIEKVVCDTGDASDSVSIQAIKEALADEGVPSECCCIHCLCKLLFYHYASQSNVFVIFIIIHDALCWEII